METDALHEWCDESIEVYYGLISEEYKEYNSNESEIHSRATAILAVNGVILTLIVSFIVPASDSLFASCLSISSVLLLFLSMLFIFWAIRPAKRDIISIYSHQTDYRDHDNDSGVLKKRILADMLCSIESLKEVYVKKVERFKWAMYFFAASMVAIVMLFCTMPLI
ncbi:MAG: hypothetical protein FWH47_02825 [Methanomassiliicoccaceae archaeon]|nr:hypothetical protein [Methanomassiliicoccaceae archaeon]